MNLSSIFSVFGYFIIGLGRCEGVLPMRNGAVFVLKFFRSQNIFVVASLQLLNDFPIAIHHVYFQMKYAPRDSLICGHVVFYNASSCANQISNLLPLSDLFFLGGKFRDDFFLRSKIVTVLKSYREKGGPKKFFFLSNVNLRLNWCAMKCIIGVYQREALLKYVNLVCVSLRLPSKLSF